jgi:3-carboxy-cis,cis-muconate cycloisomerase
MMNSDLFAPLFSSPDIASVLSDAQFMANMLAVEVALAHAEAQVGVIPAASAERIAQAAENFQPDLLKMQQDIEKSGVPVIEFVKQLREAVGGDAAAYVHWGATTQDIMDTALILQLRAILNLLEHKLGTLIHHLADLADTHRHTLMAGRTHSQQALPTTFGFKVAGWLMPLLRHHTRLAELKPRLLVVQFGGGVGTLAALGDMGLKVQAALAQELDLAVPVITWHSQRDTLAELGGWLSLVTGSLAKMAQDIILMSQSEVDELRESHDPARGGSSTMPQKSNPIISEVIIAAARTNAVNLAALHQAIIHEHERATGAWQMEWLTLPPMLNLTGAALDKALFLSENMVVNAAHMQRNVAASHGLMLAEALDLALTPFIGRTEAKKVVKAAAQTALDDNRHLVDVVREQVNFPLDWAKLRDEAHYLGTADAMLEQVLQAVKEMKHE